MSRSKCVAGMVSSSVLVMAIVAGASAKEAKGGHSGHTETVKSASLVAKASNGASRPSNGAYYGTLGLNGTINTSYFGTNITIKGTTITMTVNGKEEKYKGIFNKSEDELTVTPQTGFHKPGMTMVVQAISRWTIWFDASYVPPNAGYSVNGGGEMTKNY